MLRFAVAALVIAGCANAPAEAPAARLRSVSIDDVDRALADGTGTAVDANTDLTRQRMGMLPGAVRLSDPSSFLASELPADHARSLVFYCGSVECTASHDAADRAIALGYRKVAVMADGIAGWVKAGKRVDRL
jgi:rhodanese-related sulfurtransferase